MSGLGTRTAGLGTRYSALGVLALIVACGPRAATPAPTPAPRASIAYTIAMPEPASHEYEVRIDVGGGLGDTVKLQLPVWSPGRYARMGFARNVRRFAVRDDAGRELPWDQENGSLWRVHAGGAPVHVTYGVYANTLSGTYSVLDTAHANWNGASVFMYVVGHKPDPVRLTIVPPTGWHIVNGASERDDQREFTFASYDLLIDTPTEVAPAFTIDSFRVDDRLYRVALHHNGPLAPAMREQFVRGVEALVRTENRVVAPPPLRMYTFIGNAGYAGSDGMEHLYSTQIIFPRRLVDSGTVVDYLGSAAHEYFHVWNVKRIRPAALGPFDYTVEQYEPSLWVAEGWTQYYGELSRERAGLVSRDSLYATIGRWITYERGTPARAWVSARQASFDAPFWDGAATRMAVDPSGSWINYYLKGAALALLLDAELRGRTNGARSLDDALRALKRRSWDAPTTSYYLPGRGYTERDVEDAVSEVAGADLHPWFARYVGGTEPLPYDETLALIGLRVEAGGQGDGGTREYRVVEKPDASEQARALRDAWLAGRTSAEH